VSLSHEPIISSNIRVRYPDVFEVGEGSVVDDFSYFSTQVKIGRFSHVAPSCTVAGGRDRVFTFGDFGSLASGTRVYCTSNDYVRDLITIFPRGIDPHTDGISGDVTIGDYSGVGANAVVMPDNHIPEGAVIGALSYVPPQFEFEPWSVYAGCPVKRIRERDRDEVMRQRDRVIEQLEKRQREGGV